MIEDAERAGLLKPGGPSSKAPRAIPHGLAIAAVVKDTNALPTTDKQSKEKVDALRAFGAEVIVCRPTSIPKNPRSYYRCRHGS